MEDSLNAINTIIFFSTIIMIGINLIVLAYYNARLTKKESYRGFYEDVFLNILSTSGKTTLLNPLHFILGDPPFDNKLARKRLIAVLCFWALVVFLFYYVSTHFETA